VSALILHVVATLDHGGTEVTCRNLVAEFARRPGVTNAIAALKEGSGSIRAELAMVSGRPVTLLGRGRLARVRSFFRVCRKLRPHAVVFCFFHIDHVVLSFMARLAGVKCLLASAGNPAPSPDTSVADKWRRILLLTRLIGCRIVPASRWIESSLHRLGGLSPGSRVIHYGCDVPGISVRAAVARKRRTHNVFTIGMVARLDPIKDHATLLRAFARLINAHPDTALELRLIGEGTLREALEGQAIALGIIGRIRFLGNCSDIPEQLGALDLFVFSTTRDEGFGIVLIEALAAGLPVIASDVPACREVLQGGLLGRLVTPRDPVALSDAIALHLARWSSGAACDVPKVESVAATYGLSAMAEAYWKVLGEGGLMR
jgi:glycosyltransferase involved in cell wall biosynthesis